MAGNAVVMLGSQLITFALASLVAVVLPRSLGPEGIGHLRLATSLWAMAAVVVAFGTPMLLAKELARDRQRGGALVGETLLAQSILFAVVSVVMAGYVILVGYSERVMVVVAITGVATLLYQFVATGRSGLQGLERMEFTALGDIASKLAYVVALVALLAAGGDERSAAAAVVLQACVALALMVWFLRRFPEVRLRGRLSAVRPLLQRSRPYLAVGAFLVMYQQIDVVVISWFLDQQTLGWYATADGLLGALLFIPVTFVTALFPRLSRLHRDDPAAMPEVLRRSFGYLLAVAVPVGLGTMAVADDLAVQLFGPAFAQTGPVLAVMGVVLLVTHLTILLGQYSIAIDRQSFWTRLMVVVTAATVALDLALIPLAARWLNNGAIGGALAYVVTEGFLLVVGIRVLAPDLFDRSLIIRSLKCMVAGVAMVAAVWPLRGGFVGVPIVVGGLTYVGVLGVTRFVNGEEIEMIRAIASGAPGRRRSAPLGGTRAEESDHA